MVAAEDRLLFRVGAYETMRRWVLKFGPAIAQMVVRIAGERLYLWRAVDDEGEVLDMLVQRRRDTRSALAGFAFAIVAAASWLHFLPPTQSTVLIAVFGLIVQGWAVWKLRHAIRPSRAFWMRLNEVVPSGRTPHSSPSR
jgi:hypothetical protein